MGRGELTSLSPFLVGLLFQLRQILGGVLFELGKAAVAAKANLGSFVSDDEGLAHGAQLFAGHDTDIERIVTRDF